jgi:hypothetical protein
VPGLDDNSKQRAALRATWPVHKCRLGDEPSDDLRASTTAEERLEMVEQLTRDAWSLTGIPLPDYRRHAAPVRKLLRKVS